MSERLWDRRAFVQVDDFRFSSNLSDDEFAFVLPNGESAGEFTLRFKVENSLESTANSAYAEVLNLNRRTRGLIAGRRKLPFIIEAGYLNATGTLFSGRSVMVSTQREEVDTVTKIEAADGLAEMKRQVSVSLGKLSKPADAIQAIATAMGKGASAALTRAAQGDFNGAISVFTNGLVLNGSAEDELNKLGRTHGFDWTIQQGELVILKPEETLADAAFVITPETGLIVSPEPVLDDKRPTATIIRATTLLLPGIVPGRRVELESADIAGEFKVTKATHQGDTSGTVWQTEFEAVEI